MTPTRRINTTAAVALFAAAVSRLIKPIPGAHDIGQSAKYAADALEPFATNQRTSSAISATKISASSTVIAAWGMRVTPSS